MLTQTDSAVGVWFAGVSVQDPLHPNICFNLQLWIYREWKQNCSDSARISHDELQNIFHG